MELLVYKASAGSGKTFTLAVEYIKHLIANPRAYRQILAVTFTNKATGEMKERIVQQLYGIWKGDRDSEAYLNRIREDLKEDMDTEELRKRAGMALQYMLHDYSRFRVETIDSFFQSVMRNLARELELSPKYPITWNAPELGRRVVLPSAEQLGLETVRIVPSMGSDDFAWYAEKVPAYYMTFGIRKGEDFPIAHTPVFDFDEAILPLGAAQMCACALNCRLS